MGSCMWLLMLLNALHFITSDNCVFGISPGYQESFLQLILLTIRSEHVPETD